MAQKIPLAYADVELQIGTEVSVGAETFELSSATDDDGNALPAGLYCFTIDNGKANKEYLIGQLNDTTVTSVRSVSRQGLETVGAMFKHRVGSQVMISNFAALQRIVDILRGVETLDGSSPVGYDAEPTLSDRKSLATVGYVLDAAFGGNLTFDSLVIDNAVAGEVVNKDEAVYFDEATAEWYQLDGGQLSDYRDRKMGWARGDGTDGVAITDGVQLSGVYTFDTPTLIAGERYYVDGPGSLSTTETEILVGIALSTTKMLLAFPDTISGMAGINQPITRTNRPITEADIADEAVIVPPTVQVFTTSGTWNKPAGLKYATIEVVGGGGGGQRGDDEGSGSEYGGGGGGGGGYARKTVAGSVLGATETVTIGTGGAGGTGTAGAPGSAGTDSLFGAHCSATAGGGALDTTGDGDGGIGGLGANGDINAAGDAGGSSGRSEAGGTPGHGGSSFFGGGGATRHGNEGRDGRAYGGGGAGGSATSGNGANGGDGAPGVVIVTEYYV